MKQISLAGLFVLALAASGCNLENSSNLLSPTSPVNANGSSTSTGGSNTGGSNTGGSTTGGNSAGASAFAGAWGSSTIAGLPLGNCSDVKWVITAQTDTSLAGTVTANCDSGVTVAANLTGTLRSANVIDLTASGTLNAMGVPCQFNLTGTGTRQTNDSMKVDYNGSHCLGTVSGTETLRKFPV